jgi:hypothetical protein
MNIVTIGLENAGGNKEGGGFAEHSVPLNPPPVCFNAMMSPCFYMSKVRHRSDCSLSTILLKCCPNFDSPKRTNRKWKTNKQTNSLMQGGGGHHWTADILIRPRESKEW